MELAPVRVRHIHSYLRAGALLGIIVAGLVEAHTLELGIALVVIAALLVQMLVWRSLERRAPSLLEGVIGMVLLLALLLVTLGDPPMRNLDAPTPYVVAGIALLYGFALLAFSWVPGKTVTAMGPHSPASRVVAPVFLVASLLLQMLAMASAIYVALELIGETNPVLEGEGGWFLNVKIGAAWYTGPTYALLAVLFAFLSVWLAKTNGGVPGVRGRWLRHLPFLLIGLALLPQYYIVPRYSVKPFYPDGPFPPDEVGWRGGPYELILLGTMLMLATWGLSVLCAELSERYRREGA